MKLLFVIAHYFNPTGNGRHGSLRKDPAPRIAALDASLQGLHNLFGYAQCMVDLVPPQARRVAESQAHDVKIIVCTTGGLHILKGLSTPSHWYIHHASDADPMLLPFVCHDVLREHLEDYDYFAYLEDDVIIQDPWFFNKLSWFNAHTVMEDLLQPNRFEIASVAPYFKGYNDGDFAQGVTARFQNIQERPTLMAQALGQPVVFRRPFNPHSGCFFLSREQLGYWAGQPYFGDRDCRFIGPLESAATLGIMRTFRIYKPADPPSFLEVRHFGHSYIQHLDLTAEPWPALA